MLHLLIHNWGEMPPGLRRRWGKTGVRKPLGRRPSLKRPGVGGD